MTQNNKNPISLFLRNHRKALNLKQSEFAAALGMSVLSYRRIECGIGSPKIDTLLKIAEVFKADLHQLLICNLSLPVQAKLRTLTKYIHYELLQQHELHKKYKAELVDILGNVGDRQPYELEREEFLEKAIRNTNARIDEITKDLMEICNFGESV